MVLRRSLTKSAVVTLVLVAFAGLVAAQQLPQQPQTPTFSPVVSFAITLVVNLVIGGIAAVVGPDYLTNKSEQFQSEPGASFIWGIGTYVVLFLVSLLLITIIVTLPLAIVLGLVGRVVAIAAIGSLLGNNFGDVSLLLSVVVGSVALAVIAVIPILGGLLTFVINAIGVGTVVKSYNASRKEQGKRAI